MNTRDILTMQLWAEPYDDTVLGMLVDLDAEDEGREPAEVRAEWLVSLQPHRDARDLLVATGFMQPNLASRAIVHGYLRYQFAIPARAPLTVVVVPGRETRCNVATFPPDGSVFWPPITITVAASDVIRVVGLHKPTDKKFYRSRLPKRERHY